MRPSGKGHGRVVLFVVAGERPHVRAVGVAAVQHGDLGEPAVDPAFAAGGDKDDVAVGEIRRLEVIVAAGGQLAQPAPSVLIS